jgi:hypothetical protein
VLVVLFLEWLTVELGEDCCCCVWLVGRRAATTSETKETKPDIHAHGAVIVRNLFNEKQETPSSTIRRNPWLSEK